MIYWIKAVEPHRLAIVARPRGKEWLSDDIKSFSREGLQVLISMLTSGEVEEFGLAAEQRLCEENGITFYSLPIPDRSVPDAHALDGILDILVERVKQGDSLGFHCRAGIGRSSLAAALVLGRLGWEPKAAFQAISDSRGCRVPDTDEQAQWVINRLEHGDFGIVSDA